MNLSEIEMMKWRSIVNENIKWKFERLGYLYNVYNNFDYMEWINQINKRSLTLKTDIFKRFLNDVSIFPNSYHDSWNDFEQQIFIYHSRKLLLEIFARKVPFYFSN